MLGVTGFAAHPRKTMLQAAAAEVIFELALDVNRQRRTPFRQMVCQCWEVLINNLVE